MNEQQVSAPSGYYSGLLRLWHDGASGTWHASLQHSGGSERIGFTDLSRLFAYLQQITQAPEEKERET